MTIKEYETKLKENNVEVLDFCVHQSYHIKTSLGVIHLDNNGKITSIRGNDNTRPKLCKMFEFPVEIPKKKWEYKVDYLESRIAYLEQLLKSNKIEF